MKPLHRLLIPLGAIVVSQTPYGDETKPAEDASQETDQLVDCLLPGQVRKLEQGKTLVMPRRVAETTVQDCEARGGQHSGEQAPTDDSQ
jgi:hypothetical protein